MPLVASDVLFSGQNNQIVHVSAATYYVFCLLVSERKMNKNSGSLPLKIQYSGIFFFRKMRCTSLANHRHFVAITVTLDLQSLQSRPIISLCAAFMPFSSLSNAGISPHQ